ncbi:MAG: sugar ABC transporter substrate-binding protein [Spirochaeta sp. LUC14_002_19_P3]|nr:MAG: sugar ABC transporter substrate-binding protein [Spirochaeta sp. LUC14_002_19_P3]
MKYTVFSVLLIFISALAFAGGDSDATDGKPVSIEFWTTQTQSERMATIQVLADTFMAMNPGISVELIPVDENDMATQINAAAAAGTLPDLIEAATPNTVAFGSQGLLNMEAASSLISAIGEDKFYAGVLNLNQSESGEYYSLPFHGWVQGIWYRADWFEEAGLNPPETWDDIIKAAQYFYKPAQNQYGILVGTKSEAYAEQCFTQLAMSNGAGLFNSSGELVFNSAPMKEALSYYAELAKFNPPGPQTWRARDYYLQGKMAMFFYSTYIMDDLALAEAAAGSLTSENFEELAGSSFDPNLVKNTRMAPILSNTQPAGYGTIVSLALPKTGNEAKTAAAEKFIRYLFSPNAYITFLHMAPGGMNPVIREIASDPRFQADPKKIFVNYGPDKMAEIINGLDSIKTFGIVEGRRIDAASLIYSKQIIPQLIYKVTQEGMSIEAGMAWAEAEMKKLL